MASRTKLTAELISEVCEIIATRPIGLRAIAQEVGVSVAFLAKHIVDDASFAEQYARAKAIQQDLMAEEIIDIADTPVIGEKTKTDADGKIVEVTTGDMIEHRRLQVDARKWYLSKLAPKKYGDRTALDVTVEAKLSIEEVEAKLADLLAKGRK